MQLAMPIWVRDYEKFITKSIQLLLFAVSTMSKHHVITEAG